MKKIELVHSDITHKIIRSIFHVYNSLVYGFLEKVCENFMMLALKLNYLKATMIEVGLLLNFGKKLQFKRKMFTSDQE